MTTEPDKAPPVRNYLVCCPIPGGIDYVRVSGVGHTTDGCLRIYGEKGREVALFQSFISVVISEIASKGAEEPPKE